MNKKLSKGARIVVAAGSSGGHIFPALATGAKINKGQGIYTMRAKKSVLGAKVINAAREDLGKIEDLVIDARDNRVSYAILSFGGILGMGDKRFAIPWEALSFDLSDKTAVLNVEEHQLKNAPGFDENNWPDFADREWGSQVQSHYGYAPYWSQVSVEAPMRGTDERRR